MPQSAYKIVIRRSRPTASGGAHPGFETITLDFGFFDYRAGNR
jgi:hypothetical protein